MTADISVSVQLADIGLVEADVIALKYPRGLYGSTLAVARTLGKTEDEMRRLLPSDGSLRLLPGQGLIKADQALFLSVPPLDSFKDREIRRFGFDVLKELRVLAPETRHLATSIHGTGFGIKAVQSQIQGYIEAVKAGEYPPALERISLIVDTDAGLVKQVRDVISPVLLKNEFKAGSVVPTATVPRRTTSSEGPPVIETYDVFLSYKSEDEHHAQEVYEFLTSRGLRVFFSRESLPRLGSDEYHEQIDIAIEGARHLVLVTSSGEHASSKWVKYEWRLFLGEKLAGRKKGNLVTVVAGNLEIDRLPISLRNREVIRLVPREKERLYEYVKSEG